MIVPLLTILLGIPLAKANVLPDGQTLPNYPTIDVVPPINTTWTSFFLDGVSISGSPRPTGLPVTYSQNVVTNCGSNANAWAITYDDGPGFYQDGIFTDLASKNIKATFFSLGSSYVRFSTSGKKIVDDGHEVASHTWSHGYLTNLTNDQIISELVWSAIAIYDVTGKVPRYFRPPYADIDSRVESIINAVGQTIVVWNKDTNDTRLANSLTTTQSIVTNVTAWLQEPHPNGIISLHHDRFQQTAQVSTLITAVIKSSSFNTVKISECIGTNTERGSPYLTSGKLYDLVTAYHSANMGARSSASSTFGRTTTGQWISENTFTLFLCCSVALFVNMLM